MKERERIVVSGIVAVLLVAWLGFLVHRSSRFPGSALGAAFGIAGAALMTVPLVYVVIKRIPPLRRLVTKGVSMRTLLAWHIYAGVLGPLLALVHSGHRFESTLGVALVTLTLIVVVSGWIGRYLLSYVAHERHEKTSMLVRLRIELEAARRELGQDELTRISSSPGLMATLASWVFARDPLRADPRARVLRIVEAIADVEYGIRTHTAFERWFRRWLGLHIVLAAALYLLLALHITAEIYLGLRWLR